MPEKIRPLEERLAEYRDNLYSLGNQLDDLVIVLAAKRRATGPLEDGVKFYRQVADDLTKVLDGEELQAFAVTGEI